MMQAIGKIRHVVGWRARVLSRTPPLPLRVYIFLCTQRLSSPVKLYTIKVYALIVSYVKLILLARQRHTLKL